jgi:hypothetical protein
MLEDIFSPLDMAKYAVVHDYPGGAVKLAPRVGMHPGTLSNKVNPQVETHHLSVDEAVAIQATSGDCRILEAEEAVLGRVVVALGDFAKTSDVELLELYARLHAELGDMAREIQAALADRRITPREWRRIDAEMQQVVQALFELRARLQGLADG